GRDVLVDGVWHDGWLPLAVFRLCHRPSVVDGPGSPDAQSARARRPTPRRRTHGILPGVHGPGVGGRVWPLWKRPNVLPRTALCHIIAAVSLRSLFDHWRDFTTLAWQGWSIPALFAHGVLVGRELQTGMA